MKDPRQLTFSGSTLTYVYGRWWWEGDVVMMMLVVWEFMVVWVEEVHRSLNRFSKI